MSPGSGEAAGGANNFFLDTIFQEKLLLLFFESFLIVSEILLKAVGLVHLCVSRAGESFILLNSQLIGPFGLVGVVKLFF